MKKMLCIIPITFLALLLVIGMGNQNCLAAPIYGNGYSILVIEGLDDANSSTTLQIQNFDGSGADLKYRTNGGTTWSDVPTDYVIGNLSGGTTIDFFLDFTGTKDDLYSYNTSDATIKYWGTEFGPSDAENPTSWWTNVYYGNATILWLCLSPAYHFDVVATTDVKDGMISAVPIPTSVLLLGAGLLGLIGIGYRRRKSTAE